MGPWNGWHMSPGWGWGGMIVGGLLMLLFWGGIIALVFFAVRWWAQSGRSDGRQNNLPRQEGSALEILKERYARGEISREEYLEIKRELET